jgi:peptidoglycan/LPS O-acetylase OafA/YrhL
VSVPEKRTPSEVLRSHTTRYDIQGMRGIAVLLVVLYHAGLPLPGGFVGVDIFFVISGFVITGLLVRELSHTGTNSFRVFYARRIRRLLPALALVVLITLLLSFALGSPFDRQQEVTALTGMGAMLMAANAVIFFNSGNYFATPPTNNPLLNTWSLSVEEQFYLVFPLLLLALWALVRRNRKLATSHP